MEHPTTPEDVTDGAPQLTEEPATSDTDTDADADTVTVVHDDHASAVDLDRIERDLAEVETALERLAAGTYGVDEVTGVPIPDEVLAENPLARRVTS